MGLNILNHMAGVACLGVGAYDISIQNFGWGVFLCGLAIVNFLIATRSDK